MSKIKLNLKQVLITGAVIIVVSIVLTMLYLAAITVDDGLEALIIFPISWILIFITGVYHYHRYRSAVGALVFCLAAGMASVLLVVLFAIVFNIWEALWRY